MEAHYFAHRLTRYYRCSRICDFCACTSEKNQEVLSWGNLSLSAPWRQTISFSDPNDKSPWTQIDGFEKKFRLMDLLHLVHLGTLRDLSAAAIVDSLEDGSLSAWFGIPPCGPQGYDTVLRAFSTHAHLWCRDNNLELGIGTLSMASLGRPKSFKWPMAILDSRIKAARTRALFAFITFVMCRIAAGSAALTSEESQMQAKLRAVCCWSLDTALSIWNLSDRVKMSKREVEHSVWLSRLHSMTYQWLAARALVQRRLLYKVRPKTHYFQHLLDHVVETHLSPMFLATFGDEDYMHKIRNICRACHGATFHRQWAKRYALKRALQWQEIKKRGE